MSIDLSRLAVSQPINKTAARVVSGGISFDDGKKILETRFHQDAPPRCIPPDEYPDSPSFQDLRGVRVSRVVVVGYLGKLASSRHAHPMWLVRCDCGQYEARKARFLKTGTTGFHACARCEYTHRLKYGLGRAMA